MGKLADAEDRKAVERLWQRYDIGITLDPEHCHLVRDEWVERFALAGNFKIKASDQMKYLV